MLPLDKQAALEKMIMPPIEGTGGNPEHTLSPQYGDWQVSIFTRPDAMGNERRAVYVSRPSKPTIIGCLAEAEHGYSMATDCNLRDDIAKIEIVPVHR